MRPSSSDTTSPRFARLVLAALLACGIAAAEGRAQAQPRAREDGVASSQISISRNEAALVLELARGDSLAVLLRDGRVRLNGQEIGTYSRGDALDRAWRELLNRAIEAGDDELERLLVEWEAPAGNEAGTRLDRVLEQVLGGGAVEAAALPAGKPGDTVSILEARIAELERTIEELESRTEPDFDRIRELRREIEREVAREMARSRRARAAPGFLDRVGSGFSKLFSLLVTYTVLVALGFAAVFFGRRYLEGVADTARHATLRSGLVGMATLFLLVPGFILGALALASSVVGIPALVLWVPLFPAAAGAALVFGYLGVAHAAGESLAERRFEGGEWFKRANSYYYVLTGVGLLVALFAASFVFEMAGPWLGFIRGILLFLAVVLTVAVAAIGLGAVMISRAGTRPVTTSPLDDTVASPPPVEEESHV